MTLHVGAGTFLPVRAEDPRAHRLHPEWGEVTPRPPPPSMLPGPPAGGSSPSAPPRCALLEAAAGEDGRIAPFQGLTDIYLLPGHRFRGVDALLTNFHLPKSTLFMLVSAFAGTARMRAAYAHAIAQGYRFYSYGDGSLLFREDAA